MISVCYLSWCRRRRARSRWCWAPAPGGCWMWLGRERKTTKTTVWCTAKVSKQEGEQRRHAVISEQRNTPRQRTATKTLTSLHPLICCLPPSLLCSHSFTLTFSFSKSHMHTLSTHKKTPQPISVSLIQRVIYITKTVIRNWETSLDTQS